MSVCSIGPADLQPEFDHAVDDGVDHGVGRVEDKGIRMGQWDMMRRIMEN